MSYLLSAAVTLWHQAPNPSFKRTYHGKLRVAFKSFSVKRSLPQLSD